MKQIKAPRILKKELKRLQELNAFEDAARQQGFQLIAGIDEAGRGPLAGPVVAAACIIPEGVYLPGIDDSKKLTPVKRAEILKMIQSDPRILYAVGIKNHEEIDRHNIYQATILAMLEAVSKLARQPEMLLVDGLLLPHASIPTQKIIKGDARSQSIAAASIIAKETRDRLMEEFHLQWPDYGFHKHKGYATEQHLTAIQAHGPSPIHRLSFEPLKSLKAPVQLTLNIE